MLQSEVWHLLHTLKEAPHAGTEATLWLLRDNVRGMEVGCKVGKKVWNAAFPYFKGAYQDPSQGASDVRAMDRRDDVEGKGGVSVNGKQNGVQSVAAQIRQTITGTPEQASS